METECYEFMSGLMITLYNTDRLITYDYLVQELNISRTNVSAVKKGRSLKLKLYMRVIQLILETIHLKVRMPVLLAQLKKVITGHCDLMIAVVPHQKNRVCVPQNWVQLTEWDDTESK